MVTKGLLTPCILAVEGALMADPVHMHLQWFTVKDADTILNTVLVKGVWAN